MKSFLDLRIFDFCMQNQEIRTALCEQIIDTNINSTILLDSKTYLDEIDLSFGLLVYIVYDEDNSYYVFYTGETHPVVFHYLRMKVTKQIQSFNEKAEVFSLYVNPPIHNDSKEII